MKIIHSELAQAAQQRLIDTHTVQERLRAGAGVDTPRPSVEVRLSEAARQARPTEVPGRAWGRPRVADPEPAPAPEGVSDPVDSLAPEMRVLARMIEALTGMAVRVFRAEALRGEGSTTARVDGAADNAGGGTPSGASLSYERTEVRYEHEVTLFAAQGSVQTADGRTLNFALGLRMERESLDISHTAVRIGPPEAVKDPLVLHFDGAAPALTDQRFDFDLDADGQTEAMPFVGTGSGFLVWDRNGNGQADDGSELFGTRTGDGFAELAAHDGDGNGWIDEADAIFTQLLVWRKDAAGQDRLQSLAEAGVGALALARVASPFSLRDASQAPLGEVRSSGLYLHEDGRAGVMQQIDLVV